MCRHSSISFISRIDPALHKVGDTKSAVLIDISKSATFHSRTRVCVDSMICIGKRGGGGWGEGKTCRGHEAGDGEVRKSLPGLVQNAAARVMPSFVFE